MFSPPNAKIFLNEVMMKLQQLWQKNLKWVLVLWSIYAILAQPGWVAFAVGSVVWVLVVYLTAPGIFWTYVYLLPSNNGADPEKAISKLQRAIAKKPLITLPYASLGILYARNNRWQEAISPLETAIRLGTKKERIEFKTILAVAFRETANYEAAYQLLGELMSQGVKTFKTYYNYAACYLRQSRLSEALEAAGQARALNPNSVEPVLLLARIYYALQDYQAAKDNFEWALAHTHWPVESFYWLGRCELELDETAQAVAHLEKAVERITDDPNLSDVPVTEAQEWLAKARALLPAEQDEKADTTVDGD
jgi:tetratricopeptide (TPR) repeat protein